MKSVLHYNSHYLCRKRETQSSFLGTINCYNFPPEKFDKAFLKNLLIWHTLRPSNTTSKCAQR